MKPQQTASQIHTYLHFKATSSAAQPNKSRWLISRAYGLMSAELQVTAHNLGARKSHHQFHVKDVS